VLRASHPVARRMLFPVSMKRDPNDPTELDVDDEDQEHEGDASGKTRNQGEGDREAARRYSQNVREFVAAGHAEPAARDACDAIDGPEGPYLHKAEKQAADAGRPSVVDRVKGLVNRVRHSLERRR
jgi:hypothetical protein